MPGCIIPGGMPGNVGMPPGMFCMFMPGGAIPGGIIPCGNMPCIIPGMPGMFMLAAPVGPPAPPDGPPDGDAGVCAKNPPGSRSDETPPPPSGMASWFSAAEPAAAISPSTPAPQAAPQLPLCRAPRLRAGPLVRWVFDRL